MLLAQQVVRGSLGGECASVTFDAAGRLITVCISVTGSNVHLTLTEDDKKEQALAEFMGDEKP